MLRRALRALPCVRRLSQTSRLVPPTGAVDPDVVHFPRERDGLDYDLNWSLADDDVTPHGDAFRNPSIEVLTRHATAAGAGRVDGDGSIIFRSPQATGSTTAGLLSTSPALGRSVIDSDTFTTLAAAVRDGFSGAATLFVHDVGLGSHRQSEMRVRVITDSPLYALYARNMFLGMPLRHPDVTARHITLYALMGHAGGTAAYSAVDVAPDASSATVVVSGSVPLFHIGAQVATAAAALHAAGTYRGKRGGGTRVQLARESNSLWDIRDDDVTASGPAKDVVSFDGDVLLSADGTPTVVIGGSAGIITAALAAGRLFAGHNLAWSDVGLSCVWGGVFAPRGQLKLEPGTLVTEQFVTMKLRRNNVVAHPSQLVVVAQRGAAGADKKLTGMDSVVASLGLSQKAGETLHSRVKQHGTTLVEVADDDAAVAAARL